MKLKLKDIRTDGGTQARKSLDQNIVTTYAEHLREGAIFPSITVFHDGSEYWLADGFHRYFARKANGEVEVECEVKQGTKREAQLFSFGVNNDRGLSMSSEDIREIIIRMLKDDEWSKWSDEKIANVIKVSRITVFRVRKKLEEAGEVEQKSKTKYVDKHGNESEMATPKAKAKAEPEPVEQAEPEQEEPSEEGDLVSELTETINQVSQENEMLKEKIALGQWDASEIEKLDVQDILAELREKNRLLELENKTLRESRDAYQYENAQLIKTVKSLKAKLKKVGVE